MEQSLVGRIAFVAVAGGGGRDTGRTNFRDPLAFEQQFGVPYVKVFEEPRYEWITWLAHRCIHRGQSQPPELGPWLDSLEDLQVDFGREDDADPLDGTA